MFRPELPHAYDRNPYFFIREIPETHAGKLRVMEKEVLSERGRCNIQVTYITSLQKAVAKCRRYLSKKSDSKAKRIVSDLPILPDGM